MIVEQKANACMQYREAIILTQREIIYIKRKSLSIGILAFS